MRPGTAGARAGTGDARPGRRRDHHRERRLWCRLRPDGCGHLGMAGRWHSLVPPSCTWRSSSARGRYLLRYGSRRAYLVTYPGQMLCKYAPLPCSPPGVLLNPRYPLAPARRPATRSADTLRTRHPRPAVGTPIGPDASPPVGVCYKLTPTIWPSCLISKLTSLPVIGYKGSITAPTYRPTLQPRPGPGECRAHHSQQFSSLPLAQAGR